MDAPRRRIDRYDADASIGAVRAVNINRLTDAEIAEIPVVDEIATRTRLSVRRRSENQRNNARNLHKSFH